MQKTFRKVKRGEEGEQLVSLTLDKDSSFHRLINNLVLLGDNNVSHQIDHILIRENGIESFWKNHWFRR